MSLEEKIDHRVEQLVAELSQIREEYNRVNEQGEHNLFNSDVSTQLDELEWKLEQVSRCIIELKLLKTNNY